METKKECQVNIKFGVETFAVIEKIAKEQDRTPTYIVRKMIERELEKVSA